MKTTLEIANPLPRRLAVWYAVALESASPTRA